MFPQNREVSTGSWRKGKRTLRREVAKMMMKATLVKAGDKASVKLKKKKKVRPIYSSSSGTSD